LYILIFKKGPFMLLLGAHVSTSGGVFNAPVNGKNLGCTAIQIFTKNQRQWAARPLMDEEVSAYFERLKETEIRSVVAHDTYLINMASPEEKTRKKSTLAFIEEVQRADRLKLNGLVFHPGSHLGEGEKKGIACLVKSLNQVLAKTAGSRVPLLIEVTAGQGSNLGYKFEHMRDILDGVRDRKRFGVCLDTCHMYGAGYDIKTRAAYDQTMGNLNNIIGLNNVKCIHLNDTKHELDSRKDRHDNIGKGTLGREPFKYILKDSRFDKVPKVLETPGGEEAYRKDLALLRRLV
jgi:deoxyribonuclease-4